jgi:hypothetical protein
MMSTPPGSDPQAPGDEREAVLPRKARPRPTRKLSRTPRIAARVSAEEAALWARYEEREDGRLAQEADHLFDTSYAWAA